MSGTVLGTAWAAVQKIALIVPHLYKLFLQASMESVYHGQPLDNIKNQKEFHVQK